jgi:hypothetical protein
LSFVVSILKSLSLSLDLTEFTRYCAVCQLEKRKGHQMTLILTAFLDDDATPEQIAAERERINVMLDAAEDKARDDSALDQGIPAPPTVDPPVGEPAVVEPPPAPVPPAAGPAPAPPADPNAQVDSEGRVWDKRIDASSKAILETGPRAGTWRKKRGVDQAYYDQIKATLMPGTAPPPAPEAATPPPPPAPTPKTPDLDYDGLWGLMIQKGKNVNDGNEMASRLAQTLNPPLNIVSYTQIVDIPELIRAIQDELENS